MTQESGKKWILRAITVFLFLLVVTPALAHHFILDGTYTCNLTTGNYDVVWSAANSESEAIRIMTIGRVNRTLDGMIAGSTVEASATITGTEVVPGDFSGSITLAVTAYWDYTSPTIESGGVFTLVFDGLCVPGELTPTPMPTASTPTNEPPVGTPLPDQTPTDVPGATPVSTDMPDSTPQPEATLVPSDTVSFTVEGSCGTPATFKITNTGASMPQPHGYSILSGLNHTVLATGGFQLNAGESTLAILHDNIDMSDRVIFVTNDYGIMAEAELICSDLPADEPYVFTCLPAKRAIALARSSRSTTPTRSADGKSSVSMALTRRPRPAAEPTSRWV